MDEINDFFDFNKPFKKVMVQGGYVAGKILTTPLLEPNQIIKRERLSTDYVDEVVKEERDKLSQVSLFFKTFK